MSSEILCRAAQALSRHQMSDLSVLNLPDGSMWPELLARRENGKPATVWMVRDSDYRIRAWALTYSTPNLGGHDFHVFVDRAHRRKGYATILHDEAVRAVGHCRMFAPDYTARSFFASLDNDDETR